MMKCEQEHNFRYLIKKDGNDYCMQVMEIPGIIIGGRDKNIIRDEIIKATKSYLDFHNETHSKAQQAKLYSTLATSPMGVILGIEKFTVEC